MRLRVYVLSMVELGVSSWNVSPFEKSGQSLLMGGTWNRGTNIVNVYDSVVTVYTLANSS